MLPDWIKKARLHGGRTQAQLGDLLGVSKQNVNGWEKGRHQPSIDQLARIAQAMGYPLPEELLQAGQPGPALTDRTLALARLIERIEPDLLVHVEALVHALQPVGPVSQDGATPSTAPRSAPPVGPRTLA